MRSETARIKRRSKIAIHSFYVLICSLCTSSILSSCAGNLPIEPTSVPEVAIPTTSTTASPSPTPDVGLKVLDQYWIHSQSGSTFELVGIVVNDGENSLEDINVTLELFSLDGSGTESFMTTSTPSALAPNAQALFHFILSGSEIPEDYSLIFSATESEIATSTQVDIDVLESRQNSDGELVILAEAINGTDHLLHLEQVQMLLFDHKGEPLQVATSKHLLPALAPDDRNAFIAYAETASIPGSWRAFVEASPDLLPSAPPLTVELEPQLLQTSQGHPFYLGQIENKGVTSWWAQFIVLYSLEDKPVGMDTLRLPIPIPPKDRISFLIEPSSALPSTLLTQENQKEILIQFILDPWASIPVLVEPLAVPVSITQFEQIGSRLYVQGQINNPHDTRLAHAGILIRILDLRGNVQSAAWNDPLEGIESGETRSFTANLPLPKDLDLSLVEFDIRGFGFPSEG